MGVETENYEIAAKGFENTRSWFAFPSSGQAAPVGYLKGGYKSESSLMTCEAELHGSVTRMACSILSLIPNRHGLDTRKVRNVDRVTGTTQCIEHY